jgi:predicted Zn-dependent protease
MYAGFSCFLLIVLSCSPASGKADDETLLRYTRAAGLYSEGRFKDAVMLLEKDNSFPPALVLRGKAEFFNNEDKKAEKSFRRALSLRPSGIEASLYLARILRMKGEIDKAQTLAETVLRDDPVNIRALRLAAEISMEKGPSGSAAASAFLDRAVDASSETALVFLDRARNRWVSGNGGGALSDLQSAKSLLAKDTPLFRTIENLESTIRSALRRNDLETGNF